MEAFSLEYKYNYKRETQDIFSEMSVSLDFHLIIEVYYSIIWSPFSLLQKFAMLFFADIFNVLSDMKYCVHVCVCVCVCVYGEKEQG